jgi:hypothetical protein
LEEASTIDVEVNLKESVIFTQHLPKYAQEDVARVKLVGVLHDDICDFIDSLRTAFSNPAAVRLSPTRKETPPTRQHKKIMTRTSRKIMMAADVGSKRCQKKKSP